MTNRVRLNAYLGTGDEGTERKAALKKLARKAGCMRDGKPSVSRWLIALADEALYKTSKCKKCAMQPCKCGEIIRRAREFTRKDTAVSPHVDGLMHEFGIADRDIARQFIINAHRHNHIEQINCVECGGYAPYRCTKCTTPLCDKCAMDEILCPGCIQLQ